MTVKTLNRSIVLAALLLLSSQALFADYPSTRSGARMAFDESTGYTVLFGGITGTDNGTARAYYPNETFEWIGDRWVRRYTAATPPGRSGHVMVYDAARKQVILFGGRNASGDLADTWAYSHRNWTQLAPASSPSPRSESGAAYDPIRDRIVLFGGLSIVVSNTTPATVTSKTLFDTWEFDGTTWTQAQAQEAGPNVLSPRLAYDEANNRTVLVGTDKDVKTVMYAWDPAARTWNQVTGKVLPTCANGSGLVYQRDEASLFLVGGVCVTSTYSSPADDEAWVSNGGDWTKLTTTNTIGRASDIAIAYDNRRDQTIIFGGTAAYGTARNSTYGLRHTTWIVADSNVSLPAPRSLAGFESDPVNGGIWMIGGLTDGTYLTDFWKSQNGVWQQLVTANMPTCSNTFAAYDSDRKVVVVTCGSSDVHEWNGTEWKAFTSLKTGPVARRAGNLAYDATLKKTVFFGGYDESNYRDDTWLWDGTQWTEQRNNRPYLRELTSMWFDPVLKKTVLFGGLGRRSTQGQLERFNDMWSLGSNGWTEIKPSSLPGMRYGASVAVDPLTNKSYLFGGLRLETDEKGLQHQYYSNDTWQWDGTNWTKLTTNGTPPERENAQFAFDTTLGKFVLFSGWSGYFLNDSWTFDPVTLTWTQLFEPTGRRRAVAGR